MITVLDVKEENNFIPNGDWEYEENILDKLVKFPTIRKIYSAKLRVYYLINKGELVVSV